MAETADAAGFPSREDINLAVATLRKLPSEGVPPIFLAIEMGKIRLAGIAEGRRQAFTEAANEVKIEMSRIGATGHAQAAMLLAAAAIQRKGEQETPDGA